MRACQVTITTVADGKKTRLVREGAIDLTATPIRLSYTEENAEVLLAFTAEETVIERRGDYTLHLRLQKGREREGSIGIGGADGVVRTHTSRLSYAVTDEKFTLVVHYGLWIGEEVQNMRVRIEAQVK